MAWLLIYILKLQYYEHTLKNLQDSEGTKHGQHYTGSFCKEPDLTNSNHDPELLTTLQSN